MRASADERIVDRVLHQKTFYGRLGANMRAITAVNISNRRRYVELTTVSALCVAAIQADAGFGSGTRQMRPDLFAFATACAFFGAALWQRQGKAAEDIASILGRSKWADGSPADPALWQDWLMAVRVCRLAAGGSTLP
jgi:hypothetical protein